MLVPFLTAIKITALKSRVRLRDASLRICYEYDKGTTLKVPCRVGMMRVRMAPIIGIRGTMARLGWGRKSILSVDR